jgi:hypothetical protein
MSNNNNSKPRRVDWWIYQEDHECALLGAMGFSTRYIASRTGLSPGKIGYRLKKATIKRMDYRNGDSSVAKMVLRNMRPSIMGALDHYLKTHG